MTAIEWTDETWNPTTGCDRISPGCDNCYALTLAKRLKGMGSAKYQADGDPRTSGPGFNLTEHPDALDLPLHWRKPRKVFVNSMSDLFHQEVSDVFIAQVFAVMALTPQHTYQVLTKRPQRMAGLLNDPEFGRTLHDIFHVMRYDGPHRDRLDRQLAGHKHTGLSNADWRYSGFPNVWLGTSIESDRYSFRADHLRATPAAVRFISAEPLLGPLPSLNLDGIDWLIVGGESGPGARPMHPDWVRALRDRCEPGWRVTGHDHAGMQTEPISRPAFFFKQWGAWAPPDVAGIRAVWTHYQLTDGPLVDRGTRLGMDHMRHPVQTTRVGKHAAGRLLDGRTWDEYPS